MQTNFTNDRITWLHERDRVLKIRTTRRKWRKKTTPKNMSSEHWNQNITHHKMFIASYFRVFDSQRCASRLYAYIRCTMYVHIYLVRVWQMIHSVAVLWASVVAFVPTKIFMQTSAERRKIEGLFWYIATAQHKYMATHRSARQKRPKHT